MVNKIKLNENKRCREAISSCETMHMKMTSSKRVSGTHIGGLFVHQCAGVDESTDDAQAIIHAGSHQRGQSVLSDTRGWVDGVDGLMGWS